MASFSVASFLRQTFGTVKPEWKDSVGKYVRNVDADTLKPDFRQAWGSRDDPGPYQRQLKAMGVGFSPPSRFNGDRWQLALWTVEESLPSVPNPVVLLTPPNVLPSPRTYATPEVTWVPAGPTEMGALPSREVPPGSFPSATGYYKQVPSPAIVKSAANLNEAAKIILGMYEGNGGGNMNQKDLLNIKNELKFIIEETKLLPYQVPAVNNLCAVLSSTRGALDASECGLGKTFCAVATALALHLNVFVVAPSMALAKWHEVTKDHFKHPEMLLGAVSYDLARLGNWTQIRPRKDGRAGVVTENVKCPYLSVEKELKPVLDLLSGKQKIDKKTKQPRTKKVVTFKWKLPPGTLLVFDEVHYCFPGPTLILTRRGLLSIQEIVDQETIVDVVSLNHSNGTLEYRAIKSFMKFPLYTILVKVVHEKGIIECTADHKIWVEEYGYIEAIKIRKINTAYLRVVQAGVYTGVIEEGEDVFKGVHESSQVFRPNEQETSVGITQPRPSNNQEMRDMSKKLFRDARSNEEEKILFNQLFHKMADKPSRQGTMEKNTRTVEYNKKRQTSPRCIFTNENKQSNEQSNHTRESPAKVARANILVKGGQSQDYKSSKTFIRKTGRKTSQGIFRVESIAPRCSNGIPASHLLDRYSNPLSESGNRSGWEESQFQKVEVDRSPENLCFELSRVVSVEILERTSSERDGQGGSSRSLVYNIEVEHNHNYFANGVLVSNCCNKTQNRELLLAASRTPGLKFLGVSGTVADNTLQFQAVGEALGLYRDKGFYRWAERYGCELVDIPGKSNFNPRTGKQRKCFVFTGGEAALANLHDAIFPAYGVRMRKKDIPGFPANQVTTKSLEIGGTPAAVLEDLWDRWEESCEGGAPALDILTQVRSESEKMKVSALVEWARDLEEQGFSVVIFATFIETLMQLQAGLETPVVIRGGQTREERELLRKQFQDNTHHFALVQIRAGGVSLDLDDQTGARPRVAFILPTWSAKDFIQATGRCHRGATKTPVIQYCCYANVKAEEEIRKILEGKLKNLEKLNDGDFRPPTTANVDEEATDEPPEEVLARQPRAPPEREGSHLKAGFYQKEDVIYKVQAAIYASGYSYAKRLVVSEKGRASFKYDGGAITQLKPEHQMTIAQARAFGKIYGVCIVCSRALTDEVSIEMGMGPVCGKRHRGDFAGGDEV